MTDARLKGRATLEGVTMDLLLLSSGVLDERQELATAFRVALGTDSLADVDDILPDPDSTDRGGWWGDLEAKQIWNGWNIGCKNWLLTRAKITGSGDKEGSTLARAEANTREALQWFIDNRVVSRIDVKATRVDLTRIDVDVMAYRGPLLEIDLRYQVLWQEDPFIETPDGKAVPTAQSNSKFIRVPYRNLVISSVNPTIARTFDIIIPMAAQVVLSGSMPNRSLNANFAVPQGNLALSPTTPVVTSTVIWKEIPRRDLALSPTAPTVTRSINVIGINPARRDLVLSPNFMTVHNTTGTWNSLTLYHGPIIGGGGSPGGSYGDVVTYDGHSYGALVDNQGNFIPPNYPTVWQFIS